MTKREAKNRPILAVHILFAALMLSMYLPGNTKVKASPVCMTVACVLIELAVIYQLIRRKKARTAGDIGAIVFFVLLFWQVYTTRLGRGHIILVPTPEAVFCAGPQKPLRSPGAFAQALGRGQKNGPVRDT